MSDHIRLLYREVCKFRIVRVELMTFICLYVHWIVRVELMSCICLYVHLFGCLNELGATVKCVEISGKWIQNEL